MPKPASERDDPERQLQRILLSKIQKDPLATEDLVRYADVVVTFGREKLLRRIAFFLMLSIAGTFVLLVLEGRGILHLPPSVTDKFGALFGTQIVGLLGTLVTNLIAGRKK